MIDINTVLFFTGLAIITIGALFDIIASLGLLRFPEFYVRLHAATIGCIGGAVVPIIGVAILSLGCTFLGPLRYYVFSCSLITAVVILLTAPTGSHALARAAYRSRTVVPKHIVYDALKEAKEE